MKFSYEMIKSSVGGLLKPDVQMDNQIIAAAVTLCF